MSSIVPPCVGCDLTWFDGARTACGNNGGGGDGILSMSGSADGSTGDRVHRRRYRHGGGGTDTSASADAGEEGTASTSGDGDGDGDGDDATSAETSGDGDGDGDGDPSTGEEDDTGDGDGDGDPTTGDGDQPVCGDGVVEGTEQCDDGGESATCDADCTVVECGDGTTNATAGEACDGAGESSDCDADCSLAECGDGTINATAGETCDDGSNNGDGTTNCLTTCTVTTCGDGYQGPSEACDDGNSTPGDGCDATCTLETCGNSVIDAGEECDDGAESATCNANCTLAACGDGLLNAAAGETCDEGGDSLTCDGDCTPVACGDNYVNPAVGETCDEGGGETASCNADCTVATCGDGIFNATAGEACDDGALNGLETQSDCMDTCMLTSCGDGYQGVSEGCDDGNTMDGDMCSSECEIPCFAQSPTVQVIPPNLVLVLDKSGSMLSTFGSSTRWGTLVQIVDQVTQTYENVVKFGAKWFPTATDCNAQMCECDGTIQGLNNCNGIIACIGPECTVENGFDDPTLAPALNNSNNIVSALPDEGTITNSCLTPTESGFKESLEALKNAAPSTEPRSIMLLIDGEITDPALTGGMGVDPFGCAEPMGGNYDYNEHVQLVAAIGDALANDNITTYVVTLGLSGPAAARADEYAAAGGVPNPDPNFDYYPGDDPAQLNLALDAIAAAVATCEIQLSVPPLDPDAVTVTVDGTSYDQITAAECQANQTGWYYSTQYTAITLCGTACDEFKLLPTPTADVEYFCSGGG